ncbi:hypothetical protein SOVF_017610 isoform A [Spinacia oleracea]|uniref:Uncharacterized protein n=1 Tax=Spinacia oleracea TaxID=3562 RepID=A0A9R0IBE4_SPIOL|nr:uncharacterized protein LOC110785746 [Spinacia oleracea]KNA24213.1 hypothetical protein SOVF_017610 isoform A [Spinacia oleracea]
MGGLGAFWGTRMMEIVKKHDSGGLLWKRIKLTSTRKANAKKRLRRVWQNEAVLKACSGDQPPSTSDGLNNGIAPSGRPGKILEQKIEE